MYRTPSRHIRTRGSGKLKNVFQVCLLLAICAWLLYQMKHSHDKKKELEEQYSNNSYKMQESTSEISRFGRKDIPNTAVSDFRGEARIDEEEKDEIEEGSHKEQEDSLDQENDKEKVEQNKEVEHSEGKKSLNVEDHEHEDASSHEAREHSFKGDDASSEVQHLAQVVQEHDDGHESHKASDATQKAEQKEGTNNENSAHEVEHEDGLHEARERSFKGDDVSSAVDHKTLKENETGNEGVKDFDENAEKEDKEIGSRDETTEYSEGNHNEDANIKEPLDPFVESNSSLVHDDTETQQKDYNSTIEGSHEEKEPEVVLAKITEQLDQNNPSAIEIQKERQENFTVNTSDNQTSLVNISSDLPENRDNVQVNDTAASEVKLEARSDEKQVGDPTTNSTPEQNQSIDLNLPQQPDDESKIEVQPNDGPVLEQVSTEEKRSLETINNGEQTEENVNSSSAMTTNDTVKEAPVETQSQSDSSSLAGVQNEVKSHEETKQEPVDESKIEVLLNEKSGLEQESTEQKSTLEITVPGEKSEENHNSSSATTTNDTVQENPVEPNDSNNSISNDAGGKQTNSEDDSSSLAGIQNEVESRGDEAAQ